MPYYLPIPLLKKVVPGAPGYTQKNTHISIIQSGQKLATT
jgi:hypothetical protein